MKETKNLNNDSALASKKKSNNKFLITGSIIQRNVKYYVKNTRNHVAMSLPSPKCQVLGYICVTAIASNTILT